MIFAILRALSRAAGRDVGTLGSLTVNNFSLFVALMIYGCLVTGVEPKSSYPFLLLLGFLLLFPLSSDPLAKIPPQRLALWPLSRRQRLLLRFASLLLSPVVWFTLFLLFKTAPSLAMLFLALAVGVQALLVLRRRVLPPGVWAPPIPGREGGLIRKNLRQMWSVLDPYLALILSLGGTVYRFGAASPDPAAFPIFAILVGLALSTYAQCLFSLDSTSGITRYRLMPLQGWQILLAKDAAFLGILFVLILPLDLAVGATFGFSALAIGHWPSGSTRLPLHRWRFSGGRVKYGVAQVLIGIMLAAGERQFGAVFLTAAAIIWIASLYFCGKRAVWSIAP